MEHLAELERRMAGTSLRFGVLCRFTAFVATDVRVVTEGGVPHRVTQPVEQPAGWGPRGITPPGGMAGPLFTEITGEPAPAGPFATPAAAPPGEFMPAAPMSASPCDAGSQTIPRPAPATAPAPPAGFPGAPAAPFPPPAPVSPAGFPAAPFPPPPGSGRGRGRAAARQRKAQSLGRTVPAMPTAPWQPARADFPALATACQQVREELDGLADSARQPTARRAAALADLGSRLEALAVWLDGQSPWVGPEAREEFVAWLASLRDLARRLVGCEAPGVDVVSLWDDTAAALEALAADGTPGPSGEQADAGGDGRPQAFWQRSS